MNRTPLADIREQMERLESCVEKLDGLTRYVFSGGHKEEHGTALERAHGALAVMRAAVCALEAEGALDEWIVRGGYLPRAWTGKVP